MRFGLGAQFGRVTAGATSPPPPPPPPLPPPENLLINGNFSADAAGWTFYPQSAYGGGTGTLSVVGGKGRISSPGSFAAFGQAFATTIGSTYVVTADVANIDAGLWFVRKSDDDQISANMVAIVANTNGLGQSGTFVATAAISCLTVQSNGGATDFDNLEVRAQ